jgi:hypothetical protein
VNMIQQTGDIAISFYDKEIHIKKIHFYELNNILPFI